MSLPGPHQSPPLPPKILVVDDEPFVRTTVREVLADRYGSADELGKSLTACIDEKDRAQRGLLPGKYFAGRLD